jgi:hypothetical protein
MRAAATVAVIISLSLLTYRWSSQVNDDFVVRSPETGETTLTPLQVVTNRINPEIRIVQNFPVTPSVAFTAELISPEPVSSTGMIAPEEIREQPAQENQVSDQVTQSSASEVIVINNPVLALYDPFGQTTTDDAESKVNNKRWSVGALVSPTYYSRMSSGNNQALVDLIATDQSLISYSGGVAVSYKVNKRFSVSSGLYYSSVGQELPGISAYSGFSSHIYTKGDRNFGVITVNGTVYTSNADVFLSDNLSGDRVLTKYNNDVFDPVKANLDLVDNSLRQNFSYLELPVMVRYKIVDKTIDLNIIGGVSSNLLILNTVFATKDGGKFPIGTTEGLNPVTFSSSIGMGMEYSFTKNFSLNMEPTLRYYLNSFSEIPGIRVHPYSFGVFSGLTYKF